MLDVVDFLLARLDEDEAAARTVGPSVPDGARLLREVAAKRAVIAAIESHPEGEWVDDPIHDNVLRPIAAIYADHPDYDPRWTM